MSTHRLTYGVVPYLSRGDCIEASQADSLTTTVSGNRQNLLDQILMQNQAVTTMIPHDTGVLSAPAGSG
jgi:hypothetical protein